MTASASRASGSADCPPAPGRLPALVVFFDGECAFCDRSVQWILARRSGRADEFCFAPLQGETAARLRARRPEFPRDVDTAALLERVGDQEHLHLRSHAVFRIAALLEIGPPGLWSALARLPRWLTDAAYRAFAACRYRLFGRLEACALPAPEVRERFLD